MPKQLFLIDHKHSKISNENGLVSLEIGGGTVALGTFSGINWANVPYFIKTETDPTGGSNYSIQGTSQLLSVPYALYAEKSGNSNSYWVAATDGIKYTDGRVGIGTTPDPKVPLTILDNNPNNSGNAVLHLKSNDTYHTALSILNGVNPVEYSFLLTAPRILQLLQVLLAY